MPSRRSPTYNPPRCWSASTRPAHSVTKGIDAMAGVSRLADTLLVANLGNAYGDMGDAAKLRQLLERILAIEEREYGSFHCLIASPPQSKASERDSTDIPTASRAS